MHLNNANHYFKMAATMHRRLAMHVKGTTMDDAVLQLSPEQHV